MYAVKMPVFSFEKLTDVDTALGPEMKSTGEVLGIDQDFNQALLKAFKGVGMQIPKKDSNILLTVKDADKPEILPIARSMEDLGMHLYATSGTYEYLKQHDVTCQKVNRISEGQPLDFGYAGDPACLTWSSIHRPTTGSIIPMDSPSAVPQRSALSR